MLTINQSDRQAQNSSNTEATLILCGSSGERANNGEINRRTDTRKFGKLGPTSSASRKIHIGPLPTIHRGLEWPQCLNCSLSVCLSACSLFDCLWANFLIHLLILLCYSSVSSVIGPRFPTSHGHVTTGNKVASVFKPSDLFSSSSS